MQMIYADHATPRLLFTDSTHPGPIKFQREHLVCAEHGIKFRRNSKYLSYLLPIDSLEHRLRNDLRIMTGNSTATHVIWIITDYQSLIAEADSQTMWVDQAANMFKEKHIEASPIGMLQVDC